MTPNATVRFRRATALIALAWAALALAVMLHAHLAPSTALGLPILTTGMGAAELVQGVSEEARAAGVEVGDSLVAVDGRRFIGPAMGSIDLRAGQENLYQVEKRDGTRFSVELPPAPRGSVDFTFATLARGALPLVGFVYLAIGLVVWRLKPDRSESWALLIFCATAAAEFFISSPHLSGVQSARIVALAAVCGPLMGATAFHLFTTYPIEPAWIVRRPGLRAIPYALALLSAVPAIVAPELAVHLGAQPGFFVSLALFAASFGVIALERRRLGGSATTDRADVMLLGAAVSFLPLLVLLAVHYVFRIGFPWSLALLGFFVFPAAVGYGIVAKELFEIRMLARSSVAHGTATIAITGLYALVITGAGAAVSSFGAGTRSPWFSVAFLFVAILAFNPLRNRLQRVVDRVFDRDRATYREAVREISEAMVSMLSVKEVVDRILIALTDTMGVERALVLLFDPGEQHMVPEASRGDVDEEALALRIPADNPVVKQLWVRRDELARTDFDDEPDPDVREACRDVFDSLEVEFLVPILFGVDLLGAIAVGRKLSGERLSADDRQLLRTLANQSAIAIENAKAFDEIAALNENLETRVEDRTRELQAIQAQLLQSEKMRSLGQLVAGVAHELNNPIGFVHANLQLLDEYVAKLVQAEAGGEDVERIREAIQKLLKRSREGTERVKKIVQDLRTFSRMDQAELQEVDLNVEIDRTLTLMEPRFRSGIVVERDYGVLPPLRCYAGPLGQVVLNLVMNACDALEGRGTITLSTRSIPGDRVRFEVHDDGPGIPPELQGRIFEPFFTTKPVGQGTGLGLSLSHGIVERHGGRMLVSSEPGQGTTFVVELPLEPKEAA